MRVGKKATVVEAKKTRSCVVRLEKVPSPPSKMTRSGTGPRASGPHTHTQEEKKFKGPLKKRPVAQSASPSTASSTLAVSTPGKAKEKDKLKPTPPQKAGKARAVPSPAVVDDEPPPTIAAGRSRRAIKPNPKYASDDMVTPKIIRNVAILGSSVQKRGATAQDKQRKRSTSSSEDFYNKESSDDQGADDMDDSRPEKSFSAAAKDVDSDFVDMKVATPVRKRGRPRRVDTVAKEAGSASSPVAKASPTVLKNTSQLQLLRKSFAASLNRSVVEGGGGGVGGSGGGIKRKREAANSSDEPSITTKRVLMSSATAQTTAVAAAVVKQKMSVREFKNLNVSDSALSMRKTATYTNQTLNGSKIVQSSLSLQEKFLASATEKRRLQAEIMSGGSIAVNRPSPGRLASANMSTKSPNARLLVMGKQRSASPATPKQTKVAEKRENNSEQKADDSTRSPGDDFETMPTFTIVNINDIINKKTDVLISKARKADGNKTEHQSPDTVVAPTAADSKASRRKAVHAILLSDKPDADRGKSPLPRTPLPVAKKPTQKILNHTLARKASPSSNNSQRASGGGRANANATSPEKPAPRILNSMVAKKTQPVKPMIANLEDSADDESYPLSLDDEEEDAAATGADEGEHTFAAGKRKLLTSTPYTAAKKPVPATKENSLAATNRLPVKPLQRKLSPEKVVISRQGDKIIKKITCFETWYVINMPEDRPTKSIRNQLEIPLIQLANMASEIELPSDKWSSKVTLYKLSTTMVGKANLTTYTGDLREHNIPEGERGHYQPSCVMFRRTVDDRLLSRLPYDRAVIFKNKTFFTNIEGKNVKLVGAPVAVDTPADVEILLQIVDALTLQSVLVEPATTVQ